MNDTSKQLRAVEVEHLFDTGSNENCPKATLDASSNPVCDCGADGKNEIIQRAADSLEALAEVLAPFGAAVHPNGKSVAVIDYCWPYYAASKALIKFGSGEAITFTGFNGVGDATQYVWEGLVEYDEGLHRMVFRAKHTKAIEPIQGPLSMVSESSAEVDVVCQFAPMNFDGQRCRVTIEVLDEESDEDDGGPPDSGTGW